MREEDKYVDITYGGKLKGSINVIEDKTFDILYTIKGKTGEITTTSILIQENPMLMITFNYQDLKKILGDKESE